MTRVVKQHEAVTETLDWGSAQTLCDREDPQFGGLGFGLATLRPGEQHEAHSHEDADQLIYVLEGVALVRMRPDGQTLTTDELHAGDLVFLPATVEHGTLNVGAAPLRLLTVYSRRATDARTTPVSSNAARS